MDVLPTLELLAEISIGLIGFAGVVSALGRSTLQTEVRMFRTKALLFNSGNALLSSLIPLVLIHYDVSETTLWFVSGLAILSFMAISLAWVLMGIKNLLANGEIPPLATLLLVLIAFCVVIALLYGLFLAPTLLTTIYLTAVFWALAMGVFHFCMLVISIEFPEQTP